MARKYTTPVSLTQSKAASGIQVLPNGRLLFSQSSFTTPNDVFVIRSLKDLEESIDKNDRPVQFEGPVEQVTRFTEDELRGKNLSEAENLWFKGANGRNVQGWALKPRGWTSNQKKKYPVVLLIHGGQAIVDSLLLCLLSQRHPGPQGAWEDQWSTRWNPNGNMGFLFSDIITDEYFQSLLNKDTLFLCSIPLGAQHLVKERQACLVSSASMLIYVQQNSQMQSLKIGEANRLSTCKKGGNMHWTCILRQVEPHTF